MGPRRNKGEYCVESVQSVQWRLSFRGGRGQRNDGRLAFGTSKYFVVVSRVV